MVFFISTTMRTSINMDLQNAFQKLQPTLSSDTRISYHILSMWYIQAKPKFKRHTKDIWTCYWFVCGLFVNISMFKLFNIRWEQSCMLNWKWMGRKLLCHTVFVLVFAWKAWGKPETGQPVSVYWGTATIQTQYLLECRLSLNKWATMHWAHLSLSLCLSSPEPKLLNIIREYCANVKTKCRWYL